MRPTSPPHAPTAAVTAAATAAAAPPPPTPHASLVRHAPHATAAASSDAPPQPPPPAAVVNRGAEKGGEGGRGLGRRNKGPPACQSGNGSAPPTASGRCRHGGRGSGQRLRAAAPVWPLSTDRQRHSPRRSRRGEVPVKGTPPCRRVTDAQQCCRDGRRRRPHPHRALPAEVWRNLGRRCHPPPLRHVHPRPAPAVQTDSPPGNIASPHGGIGTAPPRGVHPPQLAPNVVRRAAR